MQRRHLLNAALAMVVTASAERLAAQPKGLSPSVAVADADRRLNALTRWVLLAGHASPAK